jgi:hypothetical protein
MKRSAKPTPTSTSKRTLDPAELAHVRGGDEGKKGNQDSRNIEFE